MVLTAAATTVAARITAVVIDKVKSKRIGANFPYPF
jgi:hypothetical protein